MKVANRVAIERYAEKLVALFPEFSNFTTVSIPPQVTLLLKPTPAITGIINMVTKKRDEVR